MTNSKFLDFLLVLICIPTCNQILLAQESSIDSLVQNDQVTIVVLGTTQDAGSPQIGCARECCRKFFENPQYDRRVTSLGLIDKQNDEIYLFEATPDIIHQMKELGSKGSDQHGVLMDGIFLTHAHIGHYTGLMYLGKESMDAKSVPVYAMPRMQEFILNNGPWSQLVSRKNITVIGLEEDRSNVINPWIRVTPFIVPHRDEYSETVGYKIEGPNKTAVFIPDIDKWSKWKRNITEVIKEVDYAFLDATFYDAEEINNRDISEIPHPFVIESMEAFQSLKREEREKVIFIHFNHTNPLLDPSSPATARVLKEGFQVARKGAVFSL